MTKQKDPSDSALLEQPFVAHLIELRDRLLKSIYGILAVFLLLFPFSNDIYTFVAHPLTALLPAGSSMIATEVISPFLAPMKLSLVVALFVAMPWILYQVWGFVAPGLYSHEKKLIVPLVISSSILFYVGMMFAYFLVFPLIFAFMVATTPDGVAVATDISKYLDFVLTLFFAFGVAFEVPIATIILVWMGITTPESLIEKRPYIIVGAFTVGMVLTPPDVFSQTLLAVPMWLLFEVGVYFSRMFIRKDEEDDEEEDGPDGAGPVAPPPAPRPGPAAPTHTFVAGGFAGDPKPEFGPEAFDPERFVPMTQAEMDAELDRIEAEEKVAEPAPSKAEAAEAKLRRVQELRDQENELEARKLLGEVLAEGNEEQVVVARNILAQLDQT